MASLLNIGDRGAITRVVCGSLADYIHRAVNRRTAGQPILLRESAQQPDDSAPVLADAVALAVAPATPVRWPRDLSSPASTSSLKSIRPDAPSKPWVPLPGAIGC